MHGFYYKPVGPIFLAGMPWSNVKMLHFSKSWFPKASCGKFCKKDGVGDSCNRFMKLFDQIIAFVSVISIRELIHSFIHLFPTSLILLFEKRESQQWPKPPFCGRQICELNCLGILWLKFVGKLWQIWLDPVACIISSADWNINQAGSGYPPLLLLLLLLLLNLFTSSSSLPLPVPYVLFNPSSFYRTRVRSLASSLVSNSLTILML